MHYYIQHLGTKGERPMWLENVAGPGGHANFIPSPTLVHLTPCPRKAVFSPTMKTNLPSCHFFRGLLCCFEGVYSVRTCDSLIHLIHRYPIGFISGMFANIYHKNQPDVGKYTSPMDPVGYRICITPKSY